MLPGAACAWEIPDMPESPVLRGRALYDALMRLKPEGLAETDWAQQAGVNRGFFTNQKNSDGVPRTDTLRKLLRFIGKSEADLYPSRRVEPSLPATISADGGEVVQIQKLDLSLSMGPGTLIDEWIEAEPVSFDLAFIRSITRSPPGRLKLVEGIGDSMYPTLNAGDAILVDTTVRQLIRQDGVYWINLFGAAGIKRLRTVSADRVLVKSDNPAVEDQEVDLKDLLIEGRAIWFARGL